MLDYLPHLTALLAQLDAPADDAWRGVEKIRVVADAADFAPRLDDLHRALDVAVCDVYRWPYDILENEEEILARLLALNLERAGER